MAKEGLYLGALLDGPGGSIQSPWSYKADDLTTHGLIVGMTGSGKTGLALVILEELLRARIPLLVIDPKGDLANLCLQFPDFSPASFEPWVADAGTAGTAVSPAEAMARRWREGLAGWNIDGSRLAEFKENVEFRVFTPGSDTGISLNMLQILQPDAGADADARRDSILSTASSLLGLAGIDADPVQSPEHILLSNILDYYWSRGTGPGLEELLMAIQSPPVARLGIFPVDELYPPAQRKKLAMRLNALLASPAFAQLRKGWPLDVDQMLAAPPGKTPCNIVYLAHLKDEERMFMVSAVLNRFLSWTRRQTGSDSLRCALYFDEIAGYMPPYPLNPPSKAPLMTLLKQARAFGAGILLATQNPVDVDYKGLTNMGTWFVGKLQAQGDKDRLLDGLTSASGSGPSRAEADGIISALAARQFLVQNVHAAAAQIITTRWAMSYLAGPMSLKNIADLFTLGLVKKDAEPPVPAPVAAPPGTSPAAPAAAGPPSEAATAFTGLRSEPVIFPHWRRIFLATNSPHHREILEHFPALELSRADACRYVPFALARVKGMFDEEKDNFFLEKTFFRMAGPLSDEVPMSWENVSEIWARPPEGSAAAGATFAGLSTGLLSKDPVPALERSAVEDVFREESLEVYRHPGLRLSSRPGETRDAFTERCRKALEDAADAEVAQLRKRYETRIATLKQKLDRARAEVQAAEEEKDARQRQELISAGESILGMFFGSRSRRAFSTAANRRRMTSRAGQTVEIRSQAVQALEAELQGMETELAAEVDRLEKDSLQSLDGITVAPVRLEKSDLQLIDFALVWVPSV